MSTSRRFRGISRFVNLAGMKGNGATRAGSVTRSPRVLEYRMKHSNEASSAKSAPIIIKGCQEGETRKVDPDEAKVLAKVFKRMLSKVDGRNVYCLIDPRAKSVYLRLTEENGQRACYIYIPPALLRPPPGKLDDYEKLWKVVFELHELFHINYPLENEEKIRRRTIQALKREPNLFKWFMHFILNTPGFAPDASFLEMLMTASEELWLGGQP
jgi:hypothetical protein